MTEVSSLTAASTFWVVYRRTRDFKSQWILRALVLKNRTLADRSDESFSACLKAKVDSITDGKANYIGTTILTSQDRDGRIGIGGM